MLRVANGGWLERHAPRDARRTPLAHGRHSRPHSGDMPKKAIQAQPVQESGSHQERLTPRSKNGSHQERLSENGHTPPSRIDRMPPTIHRSLTPTRRATTSNHLDSRLVDVASRSPEPPHSPGTVPSCRFGLRRWPQESASRNRSVPCCAKGFTSATISKSTAHAPTGERDR